MFLTEIALRLAAVKAVRAAATLAGTNVRDSEFGVIDELAIGESKPFIAVYTGDGDQTGSHRDLQNEHGSLNLVFEVGVNSRMLIKNADGTEEDVIDQPLTNAQLEFAVGVIAVQIDAALSDPLNAWSEIWRGFVSGIVSVHWDRGADAKDGLRFAGRQIHYKLQVLRDPIPGRVLGPAWSDFLALALVDSDLADVAALLQGLATAGPTDPLLIARATYGLTAPEADALMLGPIGP